MANPCVFTYKGKDYTYEEFMALLYKGELDQLIKDGIIDVKQLTGEWSQEGKVETGKPKEEIDKREKTIERISGLRATQEHGDPYRTRLLKEAMLEDVDKAQSAFEIMDFAKEAWGDAELKQSIEKNPETHISMFFYGDAKSVEEYAEQQIKVQENNIKNNERAQKNAKSKKDKDWYGSMIDSNKKGIERIKDELEKYKNKQTKTPEPKVEPKEGGKESAIQEQIASPGVLREEKPEVELPKVGKGNAKPEKPAAKSEQKEKVKPPATQKGGGGKKPPPPPPAEVGSENLLTPGEDGKKEAKAKAEEFAEVQATLSRLEKVGAITTSQKNIINSKVKEIINNLPEDVPVDVKARVSYELLHELVKAKANIEGQEISDRYFKTLGEEIKIRLKNLLNSGESRFITKSQYQAITNRLSKANTDKARQKVLDYVDEIITSAKWKKAGKPKPPSPPPPSSGNLQPPMKGKIVNGKELPPESVNPEVSKSQKAAHGVKKETLGEKVRRWATDIKQTVHHFKFITEKEYPYVYNQLRLVEAIPDYSKKMAFEKIADIVRPISKDKVLFEAFERNVVTQDLAANIEENLYEGKEIPWGTKEMPYTVDQVRQDAINMQDYVDRHPELKKVVDARSEMMKNLKDALIKNNLLSNDPEKNKQYFHHQVLAYMEANKGYGVSSRDVRLHKKGFQRSRTGAVEAYNTNYLESEFEVVAQSIQQLEIKERLNRIGAQLDVKASLDELAKEKGGTWKDYIPKDYVRWFPKSNTNFFKAASPVEKIVDDIVNVMGDTKELKELIAESERPMWVIPEKVAAQLDEMRPAKDEGILTKIPRTINTTWKQWVLLNPYRVVKYNLNNMSGDLDIVLAYAPGILKPKFAHVAMKELWRDLKGKGMSQDIKECLEHGVITSGLSIQEIPDINSEGIFKSLTGHDNLITKYWNSTKDYTQFRENLLRVAAYKYFKDQIKQGKNVYGASKKVGVDALTDVNEKAGKLSRELIGDYGNLSQGGQWMRQHVFPFWSWVEINSPRYYRLLANTKYEGGSVAGAGARTAGVVAKKITINTTKLMAKMMLLGGLVTAWNRTFFKDEDEELNKIEGRQLRLITGRREDGSIMSIRVSGAFSDMLSWVGLEDVFQDIEDVRKRKTTVGKKVKEAGSSLVNKFAQGMMPLEKTAAEVVLGKSFYPDIFSPRYIRDKTEHGLRVVSLDKIYRYLTKKPLRGKISSLIMYDTNPGEASYYAIRQKIFDYLDDNNYEIPATEPTKKSNALYYYKQSLKLKDVKLAKYWYEKYTELGGTDEGMKQSIERGEILSVLPTNKEDKSKDLRGKWLSTLDAEDKEILKMGTDWYEETYKNEGTKPAELSREEARRKAGQL